MRNISDLEWKWQLFWGVIVSEIVQPLAFVFEIARSCDSDISAKQVL